MIRSTALDIDEEPFAETRQSITALGDPTTAEIIDDVVGEACERVERMHVRAFFGTEYPRRPVIGGSVTPVDLSTQSVRIVG